MRAAESYKTRFSAANLRRSFITKVGINPTPGLDKITGQAFERSLNSNIETILRKTQGGTYRFTNYRQKLLGKGKDKPPREICIPTVRDKLTLDALLQVLNDVYEPNCVTPQPQLLIDKIHHQILRGTYNAFIKMDISCFYSSIDHATLMRILRRKIHKPEVLQLVEAAISTPSSTYASTTKYKRQKGLPEGLSISNKLANIYLSDIDKAFNNRSNCSYFRYVDDILILCNSSEIEAIKDASNKALKKLGLSLNSEKTKTGLIASDELGYLGYIFQPDGKLTVRRSSVLKFERAIEHLFRQRSTDNPQYWSWKLNLRITGCRIVDNEGFIERYGWLHYFSRITDISLLHHLDWFMNKQFDKHHPSKPEGLKSFRKAYYELLFNSNSSKYIPTFRPNTPIEEMRRMLSGVFSEINIDNLNDEEIRLLFNKRIRREARRLERDIGRLS